MSIMVVISPAKRLAEGGARLGVDATQPVLLDQAEVLVRELRQLDADALAKLMKLSMPLAVLNVDRFAAWQRPFDCGNAMQALFAFRGDLYRALDVDTLGGSELAFCQKHLRILSGLYGLLRPLDLMQSYRLEMSTQLTNAQGKNLYAFWRQRLASVLMQEVAESGATHLINLASQEYFKAVDVAALAVPVITPLFKHYSRGQYRVIGIHAKRARGLMCRWIATQRIGDAEALKTFTIADYHFDAAQSCGSEWVFVKE
ncbi:MAG: peroxide stress protein YaaA [Mariprofundales bacterium]|nr:peroxide stress protein YaaA [Mariprofundales bacterium]